MRLGDKVVVVSTGTHFCGARGVIVERVHSAQLGHMYAVEMESSAYPGPTFFRAEELRVIEEGGA